MIDTTVPTYHYDNRTTLGRLLARYDELHDRRTKAQADLDAADAALVALTDQIKALADEKPKPGDKRNLDHRALRMLLRMATFPQTKITEAGRALLRRKHPQLWDEITETITVTRLSQLKSPEWEAVRQ